MSETSLQENDVRAIQLPGKMLIQGRNADEWFYPFWQYVTPEAKRQDYTGFLRRTGLMEMMYKFIVTLRNMTSRPPPEQAIGFLLKMMDKNVVAKGGPTNVKAERKKLRERIKNLTLESEALRLRLENYEAIVTPYEVLNPDDFAHLSPTVTTSTTHDTVFGKSKSQLPSNATSKVDLSSNNPNPPAVPTVSAAALTPKKSAVVATASTTNDDPLMQKTATDDTDNTTSAISEVESEEQKKAENKFAAFAEPTLADLDVQGLLEYVVEVGRLDSPRDTVAGEKKSSKRGKKASMKSQLGCGTLPAVELAQDKTGTAEDRKMRFPPLFLIQQSKFEDRLVQLGL